MLYVYIYVYIYIYIYTLTPNAISPDECGKLCLPYETNL